MRPTFSESTTKTATAIFFFIGSIAGLVISSFSLTSANVACNNIQELESRLEQTVQKNDKANFITELEGTSFENVFLLNNGCKLSPATFRLLIKLKVKSGEFLF